MTNYIVFLVVLAVGIWWIRRQVRADLTLPPQGTPPGGGTTPDPDAELPDPEPVQPERPELPPV